MRKLIVREANGDHFINHIDVDDVVTAMTLVDEVATATTVERDANQDVIITVAKA